MAYGRGDNSNITTEFNTSMLRLISINKLMDDCNEYSRGCYVGGYDLEHLKLWRNTLVSIYREISPKLNKEEKKDIVNMFKQGSKLGKITATKRTPNGTIKTIDPRLFKQHWNLLSKIDSKLKILADDKGMLMINKKDLGDAIGEGDE